MLIHFWGVRGSLPTPLTPQQVQSKIMAAIQRATENDVKTVESKAKFVATLPSWIFGTAGGNTACLELVNNNTHVILDAGSGLRVMGKNRKCPEKYYVFLSHYHWDHIQGFPFFDHIFNPNCTFEIFYPDENSEKWFRNQMTEPYSPPSVAKSITKKLIFSKLLLDKQFEVEGIKITAHKMRHPGDSYSYSFEYGGKKFVYATDIEIKSTDYLKSNAGDAVFANTDIIVIDSQYTVEEAYRKENWGHSAFCYVIDFAVYYNIKKIYLFHHEPTYDDKKLNSILEAARWYAQYINHSNIEIELAKEDIEIVL